MTPQEILKKGDLKEKKKLFSFHSGTSNEVVLFKFNLWARYFLPKYFKSEDAPFHEEMNQANLDIYRGNLEAFVNAAFRGAGKDMKMKLFIPFCIANDLDHFRKYFKVLSEDGDNSKQSVTDIYNILMHPKIAQMYPEIFQKTNTKREERMSSFTTSTGVKVVADTVGVDQRGANQEETRPDFIWFNDFETRKTLRSGVETKSIAENMEEARTGLEKGGGCVYTCNYVSEQGNVHKLITEKLSHRKKVLITPIRDENGEPTWSRYTKEEIAAMEVDDEDFSGERMCKPDASKDIYFDRALLEEMPVRKPVKVISDFKMFKEYKPGHRYAGGHDVAGGVGLDSSTSVFIDFTGHVAQVVATYRSNTIGPEAFGDEIYSEANRFGGCLVAPENNKYDQAVLKAKLLGADVFKMPARAIKTNITLPTIYGWTTTSLSKSNMFDSLRDAIADGLIELNDEELIAEAKAYTRNDLINREVDPRLATRHFDLLTACAIAWQMKDHAKAKVKPAKINTIWTKEKVNPAE